MGFVKASALALAASSCILSFVSAQTYTNCNPLQRTCPNDPALGGAISVDYTSGPSKEFDATGDSFSYNGDGAQLTVSTSGNNPTFISPWYIMFGKVDVLMKTAPGVGMVSSFILQSDDLDEIDWEILGADPTGAQTNYFGKGITGTYNREITVAAPTSQTEFNTYTIEYTPQAITWSINGAVLRILTPEAAAAAGNPYPQTPMQVKIGAWAGGDPSNSQGTIQWAGGPINYGDGPFVMEVQSISVADYSTGSAYRYTDTSGSWQSIQAIGGTVDVGSGNIKAAPAPAPAPSSSSPARAAPTSAPSSDPPQQTGYPFVPSKTQTHAPDPAADGGPATATTSTPPWASLFPSGSTANRSQPTPLSDSSSQSPSTLSTVPAPKPSIGTVSHPSGNGPTPTVKPTSTPVPAPANAGHATIPGMAMVICALSMLLLV